MTAKIVSDGQTGVDRGASNAAVREESSPTTGKRRNKAIRALVVCLLLGIGFVATILLMKVPFYVDDSPSTVETIGKCTYYGWPLPWKEYAPGSNGLVLGPLGLWVPMMNWALFYLAFAIPLRLTSFKTPLKRGLLWLVILYNVVILPLFGFSLVIGSRF